MKEHLRSSPIRPIRVGASINQLVRPIPGLHHPPPPLHAPVRYVRYAQDAVEDLLLHRGLFGSSSSSSSST